MGFVTQTVQNYLKWLSPTDRTFDIMFRSERLHEYSPSCTAMSMSAVIFREGRAQREENIIRVLPIYVTD